MGGKMIPASEVGRLIDLAVEQRLEQRLQVVLAEQTISHYSGPLPPADETKKFEELHSGFTNRMLSMSERSLEAQIESNRRREWMAFSDAILGKLIATAVIFLFLAGGIYLLRSGNKTEGWVALVAGIGSIWFSINSRAKEKPKEKPKP